MSSHRVLLLNATCYTQHTDSELFERRIRSGDRFKTTFVKTVSRGVTIVMHNASFHRPKKLRNLTRNHGVKIRFLPAYSPDLNPIEKTWAQMKKALIEHAPNEESLQNAILRFFDKS
ncbi:MAG: transposase [Planctomycetia bacterium]|nr:transposase [Planctomycetia bacterium]